MNKSVFQTILNIFLSGCSLSTSPAQLATLTMDAALSEIGTKIAFQEEVVSTVVAQIAMTEKAKPTIPPLTSPTAPPMPTFPPGPTAPPGYQHYYFDFGYCSSQTSEIIGNPKDEIGCVVGSSGMRDLKVGDIWEESFLVLPDRQMFCTLYQEDHSYIMSDIDTAGTGLVSCHP